MAMDLTEKLISLIQPHPCLYDCRDKSYKNALKKSILWEHISKEMNQNCETIKVKWKNLKDGYTKYKKNIKLSTRPGKKKTYVNWVWGPYLSFLDGAIMPRTSTFNVVVSSESSNSVEVDKALTSSENEVDDTEVNSHDAEDTNAAMSASPPAPTYWSSRKRGTSDNELKDKKVKRRASDHEDNFVLEYKEDKDSIDLLFASYAKSLKEMKPRTQAAVKIKLAQVFADAELQDLKSENHNDSESILS